MRKKAALLTTLGLMVNLLLPQPVSADYLTGDLQRLHWLCNDYQLPIKGYVIEGWFSLYNRPGLQNTLEERLQIKAGQYQGNLLDGSALNSSMLQRGHKIYIELQLITEDFQTAQHYYTLWQSFADNYKECQPVGVTIITEFPECLTMHTREQLLGELQQGLGVDETALHYLDSVQQASGYSPQLRHGLKIGGETINYNFAFAERDSQTILYLATPVIYQQY